MTRVPALPATLRQLADLAEIRGADADAADLRRAAGAVDALGPEAAGHVERLARRERLSDIPGIAPTLHWRISEILAGGGARLIAAARAGVPFALRHLLEAAAIETPEAAALTRLGLVTAADLTLALDDGRIRQGPGADLDSRLRAALAALPRPQRPGTLGRAWDLLESLLAAIAETGRVIQTMEPAGDVRRFEPLVDGLVLVGRAVDPPASIAAIGAVPGVEDVLHRTHRRLILLYQGTEVDVRVAAPDEFGTALFLATGSRAHLAGMAARSGRRPALQAREEDVYAQAGLPWIAPELRQGTGEIEAGAARALPALVARTDIRGDLHLHSTYSDGRDTLETMIQAASALGYEYIAITDHSERAGASRTVDAVALARQRSDVERLRVRFPRLAILHGIEVDIMPNGRLDFPDRVLEPLDIVLASLHDDAGQDPRTLTERCLAAIRHPLVNVITHPANQLVGHRPGYALDFARVYAAAAETGTALEIDGGPGHLDLDGEHARAAVAAGVTVTIDSDCHRARSLERQMRLGVGTARRGWVEPRHVLNTRGIAEVRAFVAAKRLGAPPRQRHRS